MMEGMYVSVINKLSLLLNVNIKLSLEKFPKYLIEEKLVLIEEHTKWHAEISCASTSS